MRPGGAGLLLAILLAAGCKGTDPKPAPARDPAGTPTSRPKGKNTDWLDAMNKLPGAGTGVPRAGSWADPRDPGFDATKEGRGLLAGRVLDPNGQGAKNVFIRIDPVGEGATGGAPLGILTDSAGYFAAKDLVPGKAYTLTAEAKTAEGRALSGVVQTRPPQPNVAIALRDDLPPVPGPARPGPTAPGSGLPP
ncbi:MAG: carboxypeptidase-like regulatory domain-containing protein, partial [Gemmataceae bacterium]|nr:carboxypeptidase-like regulatory domain-containing protein [Gemmataceae bacterium]